MSEPRLGAWASAGMGRSGGSGPMGRAGCPGREKDRLWLMGHQAGGRSCPMPHLGAPEPHPQPPAPSKAATEEKFRAGPGGQWPAG